MPVRTNTKNNIPIVNNDDNGYSYVLLFLYGVWRGVLGSQPWSSSIILFDNIIIAQDHHTKLWHIFHL